MSEQNNNNSFDEIKDKIEDTFEELNNIEDTTALYDPQDIQNNKVMAILAYLGILVLVPLLGAKQSPFARFHTNQGLLLIICEIVLSVAVAILGGIPVIGFLLKLVRGLGTLALLIIGIVNAANGRAKELPLIGNLFTIIK